MSMRMLALLVLCAVNLHAGHEASVVVKAYNVALSVEGASALIAQRARQRGGVVADDLHMKDVVHTTIVFRALNGETKEVWTIRGKGKSRSVAVCHQSFLPRKRR